MNREYYSASIEKFCITDPDDICLILMKEHGFSIEIQDKYAWFEEINILQRVLKPFCGKIYFEYSIPRMGKRIDAVVIIGPVIFILEFKIGEKTFLSTDIDQVWDYALDLKYFHETSHNQYIAPILIASRAKAPGIKISFTPQNDKIIIPLKCNADSLGIAIENLLKTVKEEKIDPRTWEEGRYCPTPSIVEAAMALYRGHSVTEISRNDAGAINLSDTSEEISNIIRFSRENSTKSICFVTGVPGAGKTLVGLNIATQHMDMSNDLYSVFLSGNGPLVEVLREALSRDKVRYERKKGNKIKKADALREVKLFIQNVHHFRDYCLIDKKPPLDHVALFDEAQRAWNLQQTKNFMTRKKHISDFNMSEPAFLISCLDRHPDWAVIICLVGGGQEINTGEAGISEWIRSLNTSFPHWHIYISSRLHDSEYSLGEVGEKLFNQRNVVTRDKLHLDVSLRSFRAEKVSLFVKQLLDLEKNAARETLKEIGANYPVVLTRDLSKAKTWLKNNARGSERYGILVSSQAERLKVYAIDVKTPVKPTHWFLDDKTDVRSSYYLEDVATEFHVQGLELDWACVTWDADFRHTENGWHHRSFRGNKWLNIKSDERKIYLKNAYRVLLTRARQGMVIVVPDGDSDDHTRRHEYYDPTYEYLKDIGLKII